MGLTIKQRELVTQQTDGDFIREFGLRIIYHYTNLKGKSCYRYEDDLHGNLHLTRTCRSLEDKGMIVIDYGCSDDEILCHILSDRDQVGAYPCFVTLNPIKSLVRVN